MRIKFQKLAGWLVYSPSCSPLSSDKVLELLSTPATEVLRNHHRSIVEKKQFDSIDHVVKQPNNKNRSLWIRFTTLYRDSEALRDLKSQLLLDQLDIPTVSPVAALEKRKFGMVIDSRIIYRFRTGDEITEQHYPQMIKIMGILHKNGYLHDDPHSNNFLQSADEVFVIDCKPKKNYFFGLGIAHNNICLARRSENADEVFKLVGKNPDHDLTYRLINYFIDLQQARRGLKSKFRKILGINYKN